MEISSNNMKPVGLTKFHIEEILGRLYNLRLQIVTEMNSYDDRNYHVTVEPMTLCSDASYQDGFVFKVLNLAESRQPDIAAAQDSLLEHVQMNGYKLKTQKVVNTISGNSFTLQTFTVDNAIYGPYIVRLFNYIPGEPLYGKPYGPTTMFHIGYHLALLHNAMKGFRHDYYDQRTSAWSLTELPRLRDMLSIVQDSANRDLARTVINNYETIVPPLYKNIETGVIHGDINTQNILTNKASTSRNGGEEVFTIEALLDFGDASRSYLVFDIAIAIAHIMQENKEVDMIDIGGYILAGYLSSRSINSEEMQVLKSCVCGRILQCLVHGEHSAVTDPGNLYVQSTFTGGWSVLKRLFECDDEWLNDRWCHIIEQSGR